jgi:hypothetical protein
LFTPPYTADISNLMSNREPGVMFWVDNNYAVVGTFRPDTLNVQYPAPPAAHNTPNDWYFPSWTMGAAYLQANFNAGVYGGAFFSVIGPGKNYQLETGKSQYYFGWTGGANSTYTSFPASKLVQMEPAIYPARLPGVVELSGPANGTLAAPRQVVFSCSTVLNAVKYEVLVGPDAQHVTSVAWKGSVPPTNALPDLPFSSTWWTIRATDAHGTTSWADPRNVLRETDGDGFQLSYQAEGANALRFSWYSYGGMQCDLEFSPALATPSWQTIASFGPSVSLIQYTNPIPTNLSGFYRLRYYPGNQ